jgi:hypothetical protein
MGLLDLLLDDDTTRAKKFAQTISPASTSSPIEVTDGDEGGDGDTVRAQVSEDRKMSSNPELSFPHCPRCLSYYLYRQNDQGNYQCESCGLQDISETAARRIQ